MAKLHCLCGFIIYDIQDEDSLGWKGSVASFSSRHHAFEVLLINAGAYIRSVESKTRPQWMGQHYEPNLIPITNHEDVLGDIFSTYLEDTRIAYECEACGRIWLPSPTGSGYYPFRPEEPDTTPRGFFQPWNPTKPTDESP